MCRLPFDILWLLQEEGIDSPRPKHIRPYLSVNFNFGKKWTSRISSSFITVNQRKSFSCFVRPSPPNRRRSRTTDQAYSSRVGPGSIITPVARVCRRRRLNREVIQLRLQKLRHRMSYVLHVHGRLQKDYLLPWMVLQNKTFEYFYDLSLFWSFLFEYWIYSAEWTNKMPQISVSRHKI